MNPTPDGKAVHSDEIHGLGPDALTGECSVAVNDEKQHLFSAIAPCRTCLARVRPMATGSTASRWLGFETRWSATLLPLRRCIVAGGAHVILNVAAAENAARVYVFKF